MKKSFWVFLLTMTVLFGVASFFMTATAAETVDSGECGEHLTWILDDAGTLTISGTGEMDNWGLNQKKPWENNRSEIQEVIISDGVTSIGDYAFFSYEHLTSVSISGSVTEIGEAVFYHCTGLSDITVAPDNANYASEDGALFDKSKTTLIQYPLGSGRTSYTVPESVTVIGGMAFDYCSTLKSVNIPSGVCNIEMTPFGNCTGLTEITVDPDNANYTSEDGVLFDRNKTTLIQYPVGNERTSYTVPDGVTAIEPSAFTCCQSLTSLTIGPDVASIGAFAFYSCYYLTEIAIPDGVKSIGEQTFYLCVSLAEVTLPDSIESIGDGAFYFCPVVNVYYNGTEGQWDSIAIGLQNDALMAADVHYLTELKGLTVDEEGNFSMTAVNVPKDAAVFLALYDSEGRLISVEALSITEGTAQKTVSLDGVEKVQAFIWEKDTMMPLCVTKGYEI